MNSFTRTSVFTIVVTGLVMLGSVAWAATPEGVSPGAVDRVATIRGECPAFSWGEVGGASFYELVAYELPQDVDLATDFDLPQDTQVIYQRVPRGASSWTPTIESCLIPGGSYVWFVRAVFDENDVLEASEWSQGLFFSVAAAPSTEQVQQALDVLHRYLEQGGGGTEELGALLSDAREPVPARHGSHGVLGKLAGETLPGSAAIKGEMPDLTGETYGVYGVTNSTTDGSIGVVGESTAASGEAYGIGGITASAEGAGVIAYNAADGPDLQLTSDTAGSAWLTEAGIDRNFPAPVTFDIHNSAPAGSMTLQVDGVDVVTTLTDLDTLGGLSCASGELAKWNGSQWSCDDDLDTDTLAALSCAPDQIAKWNGAVWSCSPDEGTTYSAGNQLDLVGTTFNVVEGPGSGLDADRLDGFDSVDFADVAHSHLGQTWTGSATHGLKAENSAASGFGLIGWATVPTGASYGVFGKSNSPSGYGVWGWADSATGETYGVSGLSSSQVGHGVHGEASHGTGPTKGVSGESGSTNGIGVYGEASASSGPTRGVMGRSDSPDGRGVYGYAGDATGENSGVFGQTASPAGYGVYGENTAGGLAGFFAGDVAQSESAGGLVKAAAEVFCSSSGSYVARSMNFVPDAGPITITDHAVPGWCFIDFGFPISDRFWTVSTTAVDYHRTAQCSQGGGEYLFCATAPSSGGNLDGTIIVIVF